MFPTRSQLIPPTSYLVQINQQYQYCKECRKKKACDGCVFCLLFFPPSVLLYFNLTNPPSPSDFGQSLSPPARSRGLSVLLLFCMAVVGSHLLHYEILGFAKICVWLLLQSSLLALRLVKEFCPGGLVVLSELALSAPLSTQHTNTKICKECFKTRYFIFLRLNEYSFDTFSSVL